MCECELNVGVFASVPHRQFCTEPIDLFRTINALWQALRGCSLSDALFPHFRIVHMIILPRRLPLTAHSLWSCGLELGRHVLSALQGRIVDQKRGRLRLPTVQTVCSRIVVAETVWQRAPAGVFRR